MFYRPLLRKIAQTGRKAWQGRRFVGELNPERAVQGSNRARARIAGRANRAAVAGQRRVAGAHSYIGQSTQRAPEFIASAYDAMALSAPIVAKAAGQAGKRFITDPGPAWSAARSIGKGAALYGVGDALGELSSEMEAAGKGGSWIPGLVGFGFKAAGWRAGLRAAPRSLAAMKNPTLKAIGRTSLGMYERLAYKMPRQLAAGVLGVSGRAAGSLLTSVPVGAALLVPRALRGVGQIGKAFAGGLWDTGAAAWTKAGSKGYIAQKAFWSNPAGRDYSKYMNWAQRQGARGAPRGILNRIEGVDLMKGGHPWLGLTAIGAAGGAMSVTTKPGYVSGGINPQNYGGGITYGNNRGYRSVSLGHQNVAQRMVSGRR